MKNELKNKRHTRMIAEPNDVLHRGGEPCDSTSLTEFGSDLGVAETEMGLIGASRGGSVGWASSRGERFVLSD